MCWQATANFKVESVLRTPLVAYSEHDHKLDIDVKPGLQ